MADTDLPVTGKDTSIVIIVGGTTQALFDQIEDFSAEQVVSTSIFRPLGTSTRKIDKEPEGYKGTFTVRTSTNAASLMEDILDAASRARLPTTVNIVRTTRYRNGTATTHIYRDCKLDFSSKMKRGEQDATTVNWDSGEARVAA